MPSTEPKNLDVSEDTDIFAEWQKKYPAKTPSPVQKSYYQGYRRGAYEAGEVLRSWLQEAGPGGSDLFSEIHTRIDALSRRPQPCDDCAATGCLYGTWITGCRKCDPR